MQAVSRTVSWVRDFAGSKKDGRGYDCAVSGSHCFSGADCGRFATGPAYYSIGEREPRRRFVVLCGCTCLSE